MTYVHSVRLVRFDLGQSYCRVTLRASLRLLLLLAANSVTTRLNLLPLLSRIGPRRAAFNHDVVLDAVVIIPFVPKMPCLLPA